MNRNAIYSWIGIWVGILEIALACYTYTFSGFIEPIQIGLTLLVLILGVTVAICGVVAIILVDLDRIVKELDE